MLLHVRVHLPKACKAYHCVKVKMRVFGNFIKHARYFIQCVVSPITTDFPSGSASPKYFFAKAFDTTTLFGLANASCAFPFNRGIENICRKVESANARCSSLNCLSSYFTKSWAGAILVNDFTSGKASFNPSRWRYPHQDKPPCRRCL